MNHFSFAVFFFFLFSILPSKSFGAHVTSHARISVLTCSAGDQLYSTFGHSAIRYEDVVDGRPIDWIYNYGTFNFSDDFYVKFARGQLDYKLSKSNFADFQYEYIVTGRGIWEQELELDSIQGQILVDLLEENYQPENRFYRYDFFYDNCSTRIRDILAKATDGALHFTYVYPAKFSFRDAIQNYLDYSPWSDYAIDLALGLPCDKIMAAGDAMFLPDSLLNEMDYATIGEHALAKRKQELLPQEFFPVKEKWNTPLNWLIGFLLVQLLYGFFRKNESITLFDRFTLGISGFIGLIIVFLWFFTDHSATKWNLNILWANPLSLVLAFVPLSVLKRRFGKWITIFSILLGILTTGWWILPQSFNPAIFPTTIGLLYVCLKINWPSSLGVKLTQSVKDQNPIIK